jgi:hypothetical protein
MPSKTDSPKIYRESLTMHYWGSHGNGIGLLATVDFYDTATYIRWLPQSREHAAVALETQTLEALCRAIDEDKLRVGQMLSPQIKDDENDEN